MTLRLAIFAGVLFLYAGNVYAIHRNMFDVGWFEAGLASFLILYVECGILIILTLGVTWVLTGFK